MRPIREPVNFFTHAIPAILVIPATIALLNLSETSFELTAAWVYGICSFVLFSISAIYHGYPNTEYGVRFWQKFDHCSIYLMIAGSYTPTSLLVFEGWMRWALFGIVWAIALTGCALKIFNKLQHKGISLGIYIAMGALIVPLLNNMLEKLPFAAIGWMLTGGLFYAGGTIFYYQDKPLSKFVHTHEIWHIFVIAGAVSHYVYNFIYLFS
ncbi:PAQR family membrane homeostasis protein TrhA [Daejeonella oryzae]|uniref:PAQR family membrane homeostasis protein TrhA n=1 Tax=Daejeonella oryzae TaxID=1122943 RepID=UPI0003F88CA9|nr:hemolysin III family protein [Daejeonella oryzae]